MSAPQTSAVRRASRVDARVVTQAMLDCPLVMGLGDEIATFCRGRRIAGVQVRGAVLTVHVLGRYDVSIEALCAQVSAAVRPLAPGKRIDIEVVDMVEAYRVDLSDDHDAATGLRQQPLHGSCVLRFS